MLRVRVTSGSAGGLFLKVPPQFHSRPTQDRIKQAIFSSLGDLVPGARVLDLYAGSGSLGIEALSRGAASCILVESRAPYIKTIEANLAHCRLTGTVIKQEVETFIANCPSHFDVILADPPYTKGAYDLATHPVIRRIAPLLAASGMLVWEHDSRNSWGPLAQLQIHKTVRYGETGVSYLKRM